MSPSTPSRPAAPRPSSGRRPRNSLTAESILDAAERVAVDGLDGLTMRAVATDLGASPMALYRYFATKDELVDALLDRVLGRFEAGPQTDDWLADLGAFSRAHSRLLAEHPWAVTVLFSHPTPGINAVAIGETALGILERGGIRGVDAVATFSALLALNYGWQAFSVARDPARPVVERAPDIAPLLAALPSDLFPLTISVAESMADYGSAQQYDKALGLVLAGVAAGGAAPPAPRARRGR
jgi:AcrR family transcriptional regulator